jgi:protein tyrosine/serine phosphatase
MKRTMVHILVAVFTLLATVAYSIAQRGPSPQTQPSDWAQLVSAAGVPNFHKVATNFYRSAQPTPQGFRTLATQYGVRTIVSLRAFDSDQPLTRGLNLHLVRYEMHTWHIEHEDVVGALRSLRSSMKDAPVLLHCQYGADRTGLISALYRILYEDWSRPAALDEMTKGDFGYHAVWGNIPKYIQSVDVERLRRDVGIP